MVNLEKILKAYECTIERDPRSPEHILHVSPNNQPNAMEFWLTGSFTDLKQAELYGVGTIDIRDDSTDEDINEELTLKLMKSILNGSYSFISKKTLLGPKHLLSFVDEDGAEILLTSTKIKPMSSVNFSYRLA